MNSEYKQPVSCIILAGGEGKRVSGRDKGLIDFKGKTLIQHVIDTVEPQTNEIIISANRNREKYEAFGYRVIADANEQYQGPLAGIAAALPFCKNDWVLVVPCDMPFLPSDVIEKLSAQTTRSNLCIAKVNDRLQLVFLANKILLPSIVQALQNDQRRLMQWAAAQNPAIQLFSKYHNFKNFNTAESL